MGGEFLYSPQFSSLTTLPRPLSGLVFGSMREPLLLLLDLPSAPARLLGPGGAKALIAENLLISSSSFSPDRGGDHRV